MAHVKIRRLEKTKTNFFINKESLWMRECLAGNCIQQQTYKYVFSLSLSI